MRGANAAMNAPGPARLHGAWVPALAVAGLLAVLLLLAGLVDLDRALVPKPAFKDLALKGYPEATPLADAALIVEAMLWWLCLSFLLWVVGLATMGLCGWQLHRATLHDAALRRRDLRWFLLTIGGAIAVLVYFAAVRNTPLMSFGLMVDNLAIVSTGLLRLASFNAALAFVVGPALLAGACLLLHPGALAGEPMQQMRAITRLMYGGAAFLLVWISATTSMYRLAALMLVPEAREPALKLAPTISLMGGLFLSLVLGVAYLSACAWLQHRHEVLRQAGCVEAPAADALSPNAFLLAHWPKVIAIMMPLLPGTAETLLQALAHAP